MSQLLASKPTRTRIRKTVHAPGSQATTGELLVRAEGHEPLRGALVSVAPKFRSMATDQDRQDAKRAMAEKLLQFADAGVDRLMREIDKVPLGTLAIALGIALDKVQNLDSGLIGGKTVSNTIVINGFSRDEMMGFLGGKSGGDWSTPLQTARQILPSEPAVTMVTSPDIFAQNNPPLVSNPVILRGEPETS